MSAQYWTPYGGYAPSLTQPAAAATTAAAAGGAYYNPAWQQQQQHQAAAAAAYQQQQAAAYQQQMAAYQQQQQQAQAYQQQQMYQPGFRTGGGYGYSDYSDPMMMDSMESSSTGGGHRRLPSAARAWRDKVTAHYYQQKATHPNWKLGDSMKALAKKRRSRK